MYVCLCNALTDRQVKQAAATAGTTKPSSVYAACGCRAQCGGARGPVSGGGVGPTTDVMVNEGEIFGRLQGERALATTR
jgi:bacterioferritin-associated ferredoxin